jgi:DNA-binding transcriptional MocR family regulator
MEPIGRPLSAIGVVRGPHLSRLLGHWHPRGGNGGGPDYAALASSVRRLLTDGRLPLGVRLPAERELATALRVSRTTVTAAYRSLRESGHLVSRRGAGSWTTLPGGYRVATSGMWTPDDDRDLINLVQAALPAPPELVEAALAVAADLDRYAGGAGYHPTGLVELRERVAAAYTRRGLPTSVEQIMITNGVQHALDLVLRLLVSPGAGMLVEAPSYPNTLAACAAHHARVATHGLDIDTGWDEDLLLDTLRRSRPRLAYLVPEFQNPTGHLMPARLRERLVATAHGAGTDLVADESFVDLPLDGQAMPPPLAASDRHSRVLSIGGLSKPFWAGLRVGWVRAGAPTVQRLAAARVGSDMAGPVLDQLVAVRLLDHQERIVAARQRLLAAQRDALAAALRAELPQWRFAVPSGGMNLWVELEAPVSTALARAAERLRVQVAPGPRFGLDGTLERFLRLPFTLGVDDLREAVHRLAAARLDLDHGGRAELTRDTPPI